MLPWIITVLLVGLAGVQAAPEEEKLREHIASSYSDIRRQSLPVEKLGDKVSVKHGLMFLAFKFDSDAKLLDGVFWPQMAWNDAGLTWDAAEFGGIETLRMDIGKIWRPDVVYYGRLDVGVAEDREALALVYSKGDVLWIPPSNYKVMCSNEEEDLQGIEDGTEFVCKLKFGSWTFPLNEVDIVVYDKPEIDVSSLNKNPSWEVTFTSVTRNEVKYDCCTEKYPNLEYTIGLKCRGHNQCH